MNEAALPFISVIIPVFNDTSRLSLCLEALAQQTYPRSQFETVVVDNGSNDLDQVKALVASYPGTVLAQEATPGSYAARNRGIALARGDIIAFTDADCIPASNWIEKGVARLKTLQQEGMVVGKVEVFPQDIDQPNLVESYQLIAGFPQELYLKRFKGGATANVLTHRQVLAHVGTFNQTLKSFGDLEWGQRVYLAGFKQVYAEDVCVRHPARRSWSDLRQRTERTSGGVYDYFINPADSWFKRNKTFARLLVDDLTPPVIFLVSCLKNPKLLTVKQKLGVPLVLLGVRYASAMEKIRLRLGGISKRT
jgi:glycosyltransferase involved in cell wall biosynthesis